MVVLARPVVDLAAWMAALDLDRRVTDVKPRAEALLEIADEVLGVTQRAVTHHDVHAQRRVF